MGQSLVRLIQADERLHLVAGLEAKGSPAIGGDIGTSAGLAPLGLAITDDPLEALAKAEAVIDFTSPAASVELAGIAAQASIVHVIGTTGFSAEDETALHAAARHAVIIKSGNMSLGINLLAGLVAQAAATLGDDWDIEIFDMHHRHKVDAPSGTALLLGQAAAEGRGVNLADVRESQRDGANTARAKGAIGFTALRGGSVVGDHDVIFAGDSEQIRLSHRAEDRDIFARGALRAAQWGKDQKPGIYSMQDVLGLKTTS